MCLMLRRCSEELTSRSKKTVVAQENENGAEKNWRQGSVISAAQGVPQDDATHQDLDCFVEGECGGAGVGLHVRAQCAACFFVFQTQSSFSSCRLYHRKCVDRNGRIN